MRKELKLDYPTKWYTHKPESAQKKKMHKILRDYEIQTDHLNQIQISDLVFIKKEKRTCHLVGFTVPANHRVKIKESEKIDKCLDLAKELKKKQQKTMGIGDTKCSWCTWSSSQRLGKKDWKNRKSEEELRPSRPQIG